MISYSTQIRGYKIRDLDAPKLIISRDVVFDETLCSFSIPEFSIADVASNNVTDAGEK